MANSAAPIRSEKDLAKMLASEPRLFPRIAAMELRQGSAKAAAKIVVKGLQQIPDSVSGWLVKGALHLQLKQAKLARTAFEKALQIDQDIPFAHRQCADLAAEEGDQEGYLYHLRHMARLETLDDNVQSMLQAALLREAAVKTGIYSRESVSRVMPGTLRQALLRAGALPEEIARRAERYEFPPDPSDENMVEDDGLPREGEVLGREKLAWEEPEAVEKIRRPEKESRDRYVRVSWADAVTDESAPPLVEIGPEQFEPSEEEERATQPLQTLAGNSTQPPEGASQIALDAGSAVRQESDAPAKNEPNEPSFEHEPMVKPYVHHPVKLLAADSEPEVESTTTIEDEWVGATPQPPELEVPKPAVAPLPPPPPPAPPVAQPRFRLPPDMVLPERRPLELDQDTPAPPRSRIIQATPPSKFDAPRRVQAAPPETPESEPEPSVLPPPSRNRIPDTTVAPPSMIERLNQTSDAGKFPRDDSSILRLLGAERDKKPMPPRSPISQLLTKFDTEDSTSEPPAPKLTERRPEPAAPPPMPVSEAPKAAPLPAQPVVPPVVVPPPMPPLVVQPATVVAAIPAKDESVVMDETPLQKPPEVVAREEEARGKLAAIAQEVTGKVVAPSALKVAPSKPSTPSGPIPASPPAEPKDGDAKGKAKIATKTLAELYASQGDWTRAIEVYEALLEKFPTNDAYKRRLETLRSKLTDN